jgi:hypothetical protein
MELAKVAAALEKFSGADLTRTLVRIEGDLRGVATEECAAILSTAHAERDALVAAAALKRIAGQVNVAIHALGILLCLPHILESGETVEYVSLGAGNTGTKFDLETNRRIAEFKFIRWRGNAETIRQNSVFKDFFQLAESDSKKRKYLYVLGTEYPLKFFNARRSLSSVLSKNEAVRDQFRGRFGDQYQRVGEYFLAHRDKVFIEDISEFVPELILLESESDR